MDNQTIQNMLEPIKPTSGNQAHECNKKECFFCYEINRLNNPFGTVKKHWSEKEVRFLIDNYHKMTASEIEAIIGRSETAIWYKAAKFGLKKATI